MKKFLLATMTTVLMATAAARVQAQGVARQGESEPDVQEFASPMILEFPFPNFHNLPLGGGRSIQGVSKFRCEDVSLSHLFISKLRQSKKTGEAVFKVVGNLTVRRSYDRLVDLHFELLNGTQRIASTHARGVDAEEGRATAFESKLSVDKAGFTALTESPEAALLRITVTVHDNS